MDWILETTELSRDHFFILVGLTLLAGIVRGFSGFALSAMVMATAVVILPPIELIPMLWWLEMSASLLMMKNGWAEADRPMAYGLVISALIGWPIGLWLTLSLPVETSKALALSVIVVLAISQLAKVRLSFLASKPGLYGTGIVAGIVSGVAHVGGMVVAFYVLAADQSARVMRASLVLYLFLGSASSMVVLLLFGVMDFSGAARGLVFAGPTMFGVLLGQQLFTERLSAYYRPFCLILLIGLASAGLIRTLVS
ncbi:sulfite exporter TauE/SafE family protein [Octadecabacter sp. CECT 8868]|uniref:sulfite exporter TauE/SafE family protein n=1 Tax=Octadecabacter algicola TaxID=2909342 RepID=UPI001F345065|nr:sulfite exporter TauE/SafE family protein [Octadecabacter algicola]MCF2904827.1 sulfite exporter TauE/SafE family protein [Octadecabacter algicola]